ncbi:undecaprenyl-diphosphatase UppP [Candidatus Peregrinibacteria bacterium CG10_big_fil_rev_8_21_14_0_10_49_16]|nr:MAG: undecaprenyl-diphosphatase UppP [Candidatus Peregrinibacteria bacterium CG22_combo_CG10-13_8_21_14_all_49_11]PIR51772.1 MAG: undecaprenyl-diphosphatase UppP [Candidatus Peregrinibacteria bacterium CG10_big_fil_rev_8_21_14_0_10_49_16]
MSLFHALLFGVVEGITEFLPISSTAHLILTSHLLRLPQTEFLKSFEIAIQLGAILAVVTLYWKRVLESRALFWKLGVAFLPTAIMGFLLYSVIKNMFFESTVLILFTLFLGGVALIAFDLLHTEKQSALAQLQNMTYMQALLIGCFQSIAMVPGVSRAAASIIGGLIVGLNRKSSVEFSFLLAVPTMVAATGLDLLQNGAALSQSEFVLLGIGFLISFLTAIIAIQWLLKFIQTHSFMPFGIYRIGIAILLMLFLL